MPIVVAFMVVASLISGNLHSPLWHSDAILGRGDHPINAGDSMYRVTPAPSQGEMRPGGRSGGDGTVIPVTEKAVKRLAGITFNAINRNGQTSSDQRIEQAAGRCRSPPNLPCEQICNNDRQANRFKDIDQSVTSIHSTSHLLTFTLLTTYSYHQHHRHWV